MQNLVREREMSETWPAVYRNDVFRMLCRLQPHDSDLGHVKKKNFKTAAPQQTFTDIPCV